MRILAIPAALLASCADTGGSAAGNGAADQAPREAATAPDPCGGSHDYERCVDFLPAERMRGVWVTGFERSEFTPDADAIPAPADRRGARTLLIFADGAADPALRRKLDEISDTAAVAMEFVGRRARRQGRYGHMGGAEQLVIVDRIQSARILGPVRRR